MAKSKGAAAIKVIKGTSKKNQGPKVHGPKVQGPKVQGPKVQGPRAMTSSTHGSAPQSKQIKLVSNDNKIVASRRLQEEPVWSKRL